MDTPRVEPGSGPVLEPTKVDDHLAIYQKFAKEQSLLEHELKRVRDAEQEALNELRKRCVATGGHYDNGGFMHGSCTHCGEHLG